jgi:hypothetical protein
MAVEPVARPELAHVQRRGRRSARRHGACASCKSSLYFLWPLVPTTTASRRLPPSNGVHAGAGRLARGVRAPLASGDEQCAEADHVAANRTIPPTMGMIAKTRRMASPARKASAHRHRRTRRAERRRARARVRLGAQRVSTRARRRTAGCRRSDASNGAAEPAARSVHQVLVYAAPDSPTDDERSRCRCRDCRNRVTAALSTASRSHSLGTIGRRLARCRQRLRKSRKTEVTSRATAAIVMAIAHAVGQAQQRDNPAALAPCGVDAIQTPAVALAVSGGSVKPQSGARRRSCGAEKRP